MTRKLFLFIGLISLFAACIPSPESLATQTADVLTPTPEMTATQAPTATIKPSPTPIQLLDLDRPVPQTIPIYHIFGDSNVNYSGFHPGYDYGFNTCVPIEEKIIAMGNGEVIRTDVDDPHPSGKTGGLRIDYGVHVLKNGEIRRIVSQFGHIIPLVYVGQIIDTNTVVAEFSTCERYGYYPELEIQIISLNVESTKHLSGSVLDNFLSSEIDHGEDLSIDPALVGLDPN